MGAWQGVARQALPFYAPLTTTLLDTRAVRLWAEVGNRCGQKRRWQKEVKVGKLKRVN
jgi:hypothetical protein